jgi:DNA polymerase-3 subunit chi
LTQIFFYHNAADRIVAAAALIGKAFNAEEGLAGLCARRRDRGRARPQLWAQPPTGFIPHVGAGSPLAAQTPVVIASTLESLPQDERLFNLWQRCAAWIFPLCTSLIEIVGQRRRGTRRRPPARPLLQGSWLRCQISAISHRRSTDGR